MNHRVMLAAAGSIAAHALLIAGLWLVPSYPPPQAGTTRGGGRVLFVRVAGWSRSRPVARTAPGRQEDEYVPFDVQPTLGAAPIVSGGNPDLDGPRDAGGDSGSRGQPAGGGSPRGVGLLRPPAPARRIVFVVDRSVSMGLSGGLDRARAELRDALRSLPTDARFQVIAYNQSARPLIPGGLVPAESATVERVVGELEGLRAEGRTDHLAGLRAGLYLSPDVLFLVTDADDLGDHPVRLNLVGVTLNVVELTSRAGRMVGPLARLAHGSGGTYRRVPASP